jgi:hypothetical protein
VSPRALTWLRRAGLALVALVAIVLVAYKLVAQMAVGPGWDSYSFLANAAQFAGKGYGYTEPARPPLISVFAALPLAFGIFNERVIQVVDALLTLGSMAGFYLLVRRRFERPVAALATLALLASPPVWEWVGVGYTDLAAMGLCAWALYFGVRATEDDPRFFTVAFPLLVAASLMRITSLMFVLPFGVWLLLRGRPFRQARWLLAGVGSALLFYSPFAAHYIRVVGDPLYPFVASLQVQAAGSSASAYRELGSFLTSTPWLAAPRPIAAATIVVLGLAVFGLTQAVVRSLRTAHVPAARVILGICVAALASWVAKNGGFAASQLAVSGGVFLIWQLLASRAETSRPGTIRRVPADLALDAAMVAWLLAFFWFHEEWAQRVTRYYITMAPGVIYLVALGWRQLVREASALSLAPARRQSLTRLAVTTPLIVLLVAGLAVNVAETSWRPDPSVADAKRTAKWIAAQPAVSRTVVYSDLWPVTSWYLRQGARAMPFFDDERAVEHELESNDAAYYVTVKRQWVPGYVKRYDTGSGRVLARVASSGQHKPRALYLGGGWENYLEQLADYSITLQHDEGDYNLQGTAFLDAYPPSELAKHDTIVAFGFLWHERGASERALTQWVADGGTLVIDASHNLQQPTSLDGSVLFDTVIRRELLPRDATIALSPAFASTHPELGSIHAAPFVGENGQPWYGASYAPLPGSAPLKVLASASGRPLVLERTWGRGRVYWLAFNVPFHAHLTDSVDEARLVSAVLEEALGTKDLARRPGSRLAQMGEGSRQ